MDLAFFLSVHDGYTNHDVSYQNHDGRNSDASCAEQLFCVEFISAGGSTSAHQQIADHQYHQSYAQYDVVLFSKYKSHGAKIIRLHWIPTVPIFATCHVF